jgi:hypothetical protein
MLRFDKDNSGTIDASELKQTLIGAKLRPTPGSWHSLGMVCTLWPAAIGQNPTDEEVFTMIAQVDDDGSGCIELSEFLKVPAPSALGSSGSVVRPRSARWSAPMAPPTKRRLTCHVQVYERQKQIQDEADDETDLSPPPTFRPPSAPRPRPACLHVRACARAHAKMYAPAHPVPTCASRVCLQLTLS